MSPCKHLIAALVFLSVATFAAAHPAPFSYLDIHLEAAQIRGAIVVHDFDVAYELKLSEPELLRDPAIVQNSRAALVALLEARLRVRVDGDLVSPAWGDIEILAERQSLRLPFALDRPLRSRLDVEADLFPYDVNHQTFINIYADGELKQQRILSSQRQAIHFYSGSVQGRWAAIRTFVKAGLQHILIGPDHLLFLFGLMLLGGSWWRLATIVTAFTIGHSITLSLAALGVVYVSPAIVEPAIALSIIVVGVDNLLVNRQRQSVTAGVAPTATARDLRPWMAAIFGLVHGFGFAGVLIELGLPREALGWSLAAFNVGVEIGQLLIVLAMIGLARAALSLPVYRTAYAERLLTLASMLVICAGVYWLTQRIGLISAA